MARRRSLEETRLAILDAAAELIDESGFTLSTGDLSLIDACRRAGLTTAGSGYKIWADQRLFQTDALQHILARSTASMLDFDATLRMLDDDDPPSLREVVRVLAQAAADQTIGSEAFARFVAVWSVARTDPKLQAMIRHDQDSVGEQMEPLYAWLLDAYGREMVPPYDVPVLMGVFESLINGMAMRADWVAERGLDAIERPTGPGGRTQRWHLLGCACEAIVEHFTRPKAAT